jgi:hypothetical protein
MNPGAAMLIQVAFEAVAAGITREAVLAKARELNATPEQLPAALRKMRDEAIAEAQRKIDGAA